MSGAGLIADVSALSPVDGPLCARRRVWLAVLTALAIAVGLSAHASAAQAAQRSIQVKFTNNSDSALTLTKAQLDHGCWASCGNPPFCSKSGTPKEPPPTIAIGAFVEFESESCGVATGTEFHVAYKLANGSEMEMHYTVPFCSNVLCEVFPECEEAAPSGYEFKHQGCESSHVVLTVSFGCDSTGCDGIPNAWKENGVFINPKTGEAVGPGEGEFINLPAMGVSLERPNVLIQMDWMQETEGKKRNQKLEQEALNRVIKAFSEDPVTYPGATRPGITLIVDAGPASPINPINPNGTINPTPNLWGPLSRAKPIPWEEWFTTGTRSAGFSNESFKKLLEKNLTPTGRAPIFHYVAAVAGLSEEGGCTSGLTPSAPTPKGRGLIVSLGGLTEPAKTREGEVKAGSKVIKLTLAANQINLGRRVFAGGLAMAGTPVTKVNSETEFEVEEASTVTATEPIEFAAGSVPCWGERETPSAGVGTLNQQTGTFMHELGHVLGLSHGGEDGKETPAFKPNHASVMTYTYQTAGVPRNGKRVFDYSREGEGALNEETLTEEGGFTGFGANPLNYGISWACPKGAAKEGEETFELKKVDWNCDKTIEAGTGLNKGVGYDVNGEEEESPPGSKEFKPELKELSGSKKSDWERIKFKTGGVGTGQAGESAVAGPPSLESQTEITPELAARTRIGPRITYTGALVGHYHDPATASAKLLDPTTGDSPVVGARIAFKLGSSASDTCTAATDSSGVASCTITPTQASGTYNIVASFAGNSTYQASSDTQRFTITPEETTMSYTGATVILAGASGATLTAKLVEDGSADNDADGGSRAPVPSESVTLAIGTQTCSGKTDASGNVKCTIPSVTVPLGPETVGAVFAGDGFYSESSASQTAMVFAFPSRGAFTLGDETVASASATTQVTWWADTWSSLNSLSGGLAPPAFKGFAGNITLPTTTPPAQCGSGWTTTGGDSPPPTSGVPTYMGTVVTSKVTKPSSKISGDTRKIVVVKTNPGYSPEPDHHGTGTIVATFC